MHALAVQEVPGSARTSTLRDISHITKLFSWQTPTGVRVTVLKAVNINSTRVTSRVSIAGSNHLLVNDASILRAEGRDYGVVIKFNGVEYATIPTRVRFKQKQRASKRRLSHLYSTHWSRQQQQMLRTGHDGIWERENSFDLYVASRLSLA